MLPGQLLHAMDWKELRNQRVWLIAMKDPASEDIRAGLVLLLDNLQLCAVNECGVPATEVYGEMGYPNS